VSLERLVMWRHGETDHNVDRRLQGHLDAELTTEGLDQARRAAPVLAGFEPSVVVSSDLRRAADTAAVFGAWTGHPLVFDKRLRETHVGKWQGLTHPEVEANWPGGITTWRADPTWAPPGGETRVEVATRANEVIQELDAVHDGTALLCAHGGWIIALTCKLLDLPTPNWIHFAVPGNCRWTVLVRRVGLPGWRLVSYNAGVEG
jgi:2,3-bisphosphoglycerate-dependent phosphoglycerate mutase/probable phosphoglycerate mutase